MVKVELTFSTVREFEEWRRGQEAAQQKEEYCAQEYCAEILRAKAQADDGRLIPGAHVDAQFAARRAETRKSIHE